MTSLFDGILDADSTISMVILAVVVVTIGITFAMMSKKLSVPIILGFIGLIMVYLYAMDVIAGIFGAAGLIINAIMIIWALNRTGFDGGSK